MNEEQLAEWLTIDRDDTHQHRFVVLPTIEFTDEDRAFFEHPHQPDEYNAFFPHNWWELA